MIVDDLGVVVVSHGQLAEELVRSAETILGGPQERLRAWSIDWEDDVDLTREDLRSLIRDMNMPGGVLLLTDMFGGTPTNVGLSLMKEEKVQVVCGVNLPMVLCALGLEDIRNLAHAATQVADKAQESMCVAAELLKGQR